MKVNNTPSINNLPNHAINKKEKQAKGEDKAYVAQDEYVKSTEEAPPTTYKKPTTKVDETTILKLKEESEATYNSLRELVRQLLLRQGLKPEDLKRLDQTIEVDETARLEAQALISEGGALSAENVSDRIVAFAKAISGGDKEKFNEIKAAIEEGFRQAEEALGGTLPEVSQKTYKLVMEKLENWLNE